MTGVRTIHHEGTVFPIIPILTNGDIIITVAVIETIFCYEAKIWYHT
jgi:hypothetical protein